MNERALHQYCGFNEPARVWDRLIWLWRSVAWLASKQVVKAGKLVDQVPNGRGGQPGLCRGVLPFHCGLTVFNAQRNGLQIFHNSSLSIVGVATVDGDRRGAVGQSRHALPPPTNEAV